MVWGGMCIRRKGRCMIMVSIARGVRSQAPLAQLNTYKLHLMGLVESVFGKHKFLILYEHIIQLKSEDFLKKITKCTFIIYLIFQLYSVLSNFPHFFHITHSLKSALISTPSAFWPHCTHKPCTNTYESYASPCLIISSFFHQLRDFSHKTYHTPWHIKQTMKG